MKTHKVTRLSLIAVLWAQANCIMAERKKTYCLSCECILKEGIVTRKEFEGWHFAAISYIKLESCEMHTRFNGNDSRFRYGYGDIFVTQ